MHTYDESVARLGEAVLAYADARLRMDPVPLDRPRSAAELHAQVGETITQEGLGGEKALEVFTEQLAPACISTDHPRHLSFIPCAPTEAATLFDLVVGASSIYAGSWMEGAGAVFAENQALRWIADLAGLPADAGGVFVPGGSHGNLSALVAARASARAGTHAAIGVRDGRPVPVPADQVRRWFVAASAEAHSSIVSAAQIMDCQVLPVPSDADERMTGAALETALAGLGDGDAVFAVVATAGTTNLGVIDDLASIGQVTRRLGVWWHVDGAYGGAGLAAPSVRDRYDGVEHVDSFIVDPHKWLFAPFDSCALLYRDPDVARRAHTQHAGYLDVLTESGSWSPSDLAIGLTRRARGLPFWFSLATYGTAQYREAIEHTLDVARFAAAQVERRSYLELVRRPDLTVVAFRRLGWTPEQYHQWSDRLLAAQVALVVPSSHRGEIIVRLAIVNPRTTEADIAIILDSMAG